MSSNQALLITGMHRSGTSLVASVLGRSGVDLGNELLGPNRGNPRGHFEDLRFLTLHQDLLEALGYDMLPRSLRRPLNPAPEARTRTRRLLEDTSGLWGFKDPRTCLFLDFWHGLLPDARYVFLFRHPLDVLISFLRRASDIQVLLDPSLAIEAWRVYNEEILQFYSRHKERCFLAEIYTAAMDFPQFVDAVASKLDLPLSSRHAAEPFEPSEFRPTAATEVGGRQFRRLAPRAHELYRELARNADCSPLVSAADPVDPIAAEGADSFVGTQLLALLTHLAPTAISSRHNALLEHLEQWNQLHQTVGENRHQIEQLTKCTADLEGLRAQDQHLLEDLSSQVGRLEEQLKEKQNRLLQHEEQARRLALHIETLEELVEEQSVQLS